MFQTFWPTHTRYLGSTWSTEQPPVKDFRTHHRPFSVPVLLSILVNPNRFSVHNFCYITLYRVTLCSILYLSGIHLCAKYTMFICYTVKVITISVIKIFSGEIFRNFRPFFLHSLITFETPPYVRKILLVYGVIFYGASFEPIFISPGGVQATIK